mgnify:CR=1 FL=1
MTFFGRDRQVNVRSTETSRMSLPKPIVVWPPFKRNQTGLKFLRARQIEVVSNQGRNAVCTH